MAQSKKQLENDFVYWADKSQEYANAIKKLSATAVDPATGNKLLSQGQIANFMAEKKRLQELKDDADLSAREIQLKISALDRSNTPPRN
jgi:hypothetical protein